MAAISIIVVSYKVRDLLRQCLQSVFHQDNFDLDVWVVDNNSQDGSAELVQREFPQAQLITNSENTGFAAAANQALRKARGEFLLLLNPDAVLMENSLAELVAFLEQNPAVGIVGGSIINRDGSVDPASHRGLPRPSAMAARALGLDRLFPNNRFLGQYNMRWLPLDQEAEVVAVSGSFMMIRRQVLEKIGLLDERFFLYFEDGDYCVRAREAGWKVWYNPQAKVLHEKRASSRHNPDAARLALYRSYLAYYDKYWPRPRWKRAVVRLLTLIHSRFDRRVLASR